MQDNASIPSNTRGMQDQAEILRQEVILVVALVLMVVGGVVSAILLPQLYFGEPPVRVFLVLFVIGWGTYFFRSRFALAARAILLLGPLFTLWMALRIFSSPVVPFFAILTIIANYAISPASGLTAAFLNTVLLAVSLSVNENLFSVIALLWLTTGVQWLSSKELYTALAWAWNSEQRASQLLDVLRERNQELEKTTARLKRASHELIAARRRADEARQLKEQFAANISHELRTPLNLIMGFSEAMYLTPDVYGDMAWPSVLRRDVLQIYKSSRQLLELINDVLDLARIDRAQMPLRVEQSDLASVIREAIDTVSGLLRGKDVEVCTELPAHIPPMTFDRTRIRQVLLNLLNNATRFTERGRITVAVKISEEECIVSVADTGTGIHPDELPKIFGEFYQIDMSARRPREGAGLGLAISKRFVELHGGRIWAESQLGTGSEFHFALPLAPQETSIELRWQETLPQPGDSQERCVVVLEKDPTISTMFDRYLKSYRILQAEDLRRAQALVEQWHPRAVVINVSPQKQPYSEIEQCFDLLPPKVPVLSCSLPSQSWFSREIGVHASLTKPITREGLFQALADIKEVRNVLVVDDDRGFANLITRFFESANGRYNVRHAYDGAEALAQIRQQRPDVILLDLVMPGMDGLSFLETLRSVDNLPAIPVIIVTATEYNPDVVALRSSRIGLERRHVFSSSEVIRYVQAMLDLTEAEYPTDSARVS